jgi:hypothetical protein
MWLGSQHISHRDRSEAIMRPVRGPSPSWGHPAGGSGSHETSGPCLAKAGTGVAWGQTPADLQPPGLVFGNESYSYVINCYSTHHGLHWVQTLTGDDVIFNRCVCVVCDGSLGRCASGSQDSIVVLMNRQSEMAGGRALSDKRQSIEARTYPIVHTLRVPNELMRKGIQAMLALALCMVCAPQHQTVTCKWLPKPSVHQYLTHDNSNEGH